MAKLPSLLQGVWFPTHQSVGGRLDEFGPPALPVPRDVSLLTILGDTFHITSNADYYWTGGRVRLTGRPGHGEMAWEYPNLPEEYHASAEYTVAGDELWLRCAGPTPERPHNDECAVRYVRLADSPTPEMRAIIQTAMLGMPWAGFESA